MDEKLYVRIRGRVQGPFDLEKLRSLVKLGQLGRMHEVSSDSANWQHASDYPDLFASTEVKEVAPEPPAAAGPPVGAPVDGSTTVAARGAAHPDKDAKWYYAHLDAEFGPVDFSDLQSKLISGHVLPDDVVWAEGMNDWATAHSIAGLVPARVHATRQVETTSPTVSVKKSEPEPLGRDLARVLGDSRSWVMFISVFLLICAVSMLVLGVLAVIFGARDRDNATMGGGLMAVLYAVVASIGGRYLWKYHGQIGRFLQKRTEARLDTALSTLRGFWIYVAIILIIILVNGVVAAIWVFSTVTTTM